MYRYLIGIICLASANISLADGVTKSSVSEVFPNACWIGADDTHQPLCPSDLSVFQISFDYDHGPGSELQFSYGMNDRRLMDRNFNIEGIRAVPDSSRIVLSITPNKKMTLSRHAYCLRDLEAPRLWTFDADGSLNYGKNRIVIRSNLGHTEIYVNNKRIGYAGIGPRGNGGDFDGYPVLGDVKVHTTGECSISNFTVSNFRDPGNAIYHDPATYCGNIRLKLPAHGMPLLRSCFNIDNLKKINRASITCTSRGIYDIYLNGRRVNKEYFLPGCTQYNKTHLYHTHDLMPYIKKGENEISVRLAEGWWSGPATYDGANWNFYGDRQSFIGVIDIERKDGSHIEYPTLPDTWQYTSDGPVRKGSFFQGEVYDASTDENNMLWHNAAEVQLDGNICTAAGSWDYIEFLPGYGDHVLPVNQIVSQSVNEPRPGVYVYDMGQNMAGVPLIDFTGLTAGDTVTLRFAEMVYPELPEFNELKGMIMTENLRAAISTDQYIARGGDSEVFSPRHTFHGYRYIEITGIPQALPIDNVKTLALSSVHDIKAEFECSDSLVNRLWKNIEWSTKSNFLSIPTDCPQRNERLGWMGDISVFSPTATRIADLRGLLSQFLRSVRDCTDPEGRYPDVAPTGFGFGGLLWGSAGITVPREYLRQYADTALVAEHYPSMKKYMDYVATRYIDSATGLIVQNRQWGDLGDWLSPEYDRADKSLLWECYYIYDLDLMAEMAHAIGNDSDADRYKDLACHRRKFFRQTYIDPTTHKTKHSAFNADRLGQPDDTQASYALPLAMGIVTDDPAFTDNFIATIERENRADDGTLCLPYSLMTGFIGTRWICDALEKIGRHDIACRLLTNRNYPSWLYPVTQGATSIWERLNSYTHQAGFGGNNTMNSFNHYSFGAVGEWMLTDLAGVDYGDGKLTFKPKPDPTGSLTYARAKIETPDGTAECSWRLIDGTYEIEIEIDTPSQAVFLHPVTGRAATLSPGRHTLRFPLLRTGHMPIRGF